MMCLLYGLNNMEQDLWSLFHFQVNYGHGVLTVSVKLVISFFKVSYVMELFGC